MLQLERITPGEARTVQDALVDALPTDGLRRRVRESLGDLRIENAPAPLPAALQPPIKALEAWLREISL